MPGGGPLNPGSQPITERSGYAARSMCRALFMTRVTIHPLTHSPGRARWQTSPASRDEGRLDRRSRERRTKHVAGVPHFVGQPRVGDIVWEFDRWCCELTGADGVG